MTLVSVCQSQLKLHSVHHPPTPPLSAGGGEIQLSGGFTKNQYRGAGLPKKGGFGQFANLRGGAWQEREAGVLEGVDTLMHTMTHALIQPSFIASTDVLGGNK